MDNQQLQIEAENFSKLSVKHQNQSQALAKAEYLLRMCPNVNFVVLAGPSGVGKTHLLRKLAASIWAAHAEAVQETPSMVPCIFTTAASDGAKRFNWNRFWRDGLDALHDPFVNTRPPRDKCLQLYPGEHYSTSQQRENLESEIRFRETKMWIIDEAQHILLGGAAGQPGDQFDVLKSVTQLTNTKLVLCGTHQLPSLLAYSGQVMRRSVKVFLNPYRLDVKGDLTNFASVADTLLKKLPAEGYPDVVLNIQFFHLGTLGCIGVLKDWIARAWAYANFERERKLTITHFEQTCLDAETLREMENEILEGEGRSLKAPTHLNSKRGRPKSSGEGKTPTFHKRRPGERNPARDHVASAEELIAFGASHD